MKATKLSFPNGAPPQATVFNDDKSYPSVTPSLLIATTTGGATATLVTLNLSTAPNIFPNSNLSIITTVSIIATPFKRYVKPYT